MAEGRNNWRDLRANALAGFAAFSAGYVAMRPEVAYAQPTAESRLLATDALRERERIEQPAFLRNLGVRPVLAQGERMTRENAQKTVAALGDTRVPDRLSPAFVEMLTFLGEQPQTGSLRDELARAPREAGNPGWVDITERVEALRGDSDDVPAGVRIRVRSTNLDRNRLVSGMTAGGPNESVVLDARQLLVRDRPEDTEMLEIEITEAGPQGVAVRYYGLLVECGNIATLGSEVRQAAREVINPCAMVEVVAPRGVEFTDRRVRAHVLVVDTARPTTAPKQECLTRQATMNCDGPCEDVLFARSYATSQRFRSRIDDARRRGNGDLESNITRIYQSDGELVPGADGRMNLKLPIEVSQLNDDVFVIVCFEWGDGVSSIVTLREMRVRNPRGTDGLVRDVLAMSGSGQNMDVYERGQDGRPRLVSRGADSTN